MRAIIYNRFAAVAPALMLFLYMSYLYEYSDISLYKSILTLYGVSPFRFPFLDISGSLAAWECTRQGVDVILSDPCDVLQRGYTYSPLWMAASAVPLGVGDTTAVGWILALLFLASLSLLPPPRCPVELVLVLAATLSTTVVFAVERANPDIMLFVLALTTGLLAAGGPTGTSRRICHRSIVGAGEILPVHGAGNRLPRAHLDFRRGRSDSLMFARPLLGRISRRVGEGNSTYCYRGVQHRLFCGEESAVSAGRNGRQRPGAVEPGAARSAHRFGRALSNLVCGCAAICWGPCGNLRAALSGLTPFERVCLVIGSAIVVGCFFARQSIVYRGVFLLLVIPGLLAATTSFFSRSAAPARTAAADIPAAGSALKNRIASRVDSTAAQ